MYLYRMLELLRVGLLKVKLLAILLVLGAINNSMATVAKRVISLAPSTTEFAYAAGLGDQLLAVSAYSDYPPQAKALEQVASWQGINVERILALKPDLVLAWRGGNPQRQLDQLTSFGITIFYIEPRQLDDIAQRLMDLAAYSPHPEQALQAAAEFRQGLLQLQQRYQQQQTRKPYSVLLQFGTQPLFTSSSATLQSQLLTLCGGTNIFAGSPVPWPQISREQVLLRQPQAIVIAGDPDQIPRIAQFWQPQLQVPIIALPTNWFSRTGPRLLLAAQTLCQQLDQLTPPSSVKGAK